MEKSDAIRMRNGLENFEFLRFVTPVFTDLFQGSMPPASRLKMRSTIAKLLSAITFSIV
jgi:hypothetical protein